MTGDLDVRLRQHLAMTVPATPDGRDLTHALAAVLDLHQPGDAEQIQPDGGAIWGKVCVECGSDAIGSWPCPTVRVIAEKLGVEVDGG